MKLLYGTTNTAKLSYMREIVEDMGIEIVSLHDVELINPLPEIDESGNLPIENAQIKALAYYQSFLMPVFSCDTGLLLGGLPDKEQPGVHVRRRDGKTLTDEEMIEYYAQIAKTHGGNIEAKYQNAICLVLNQETIFSYNEDDISSESFLITDTPHKKRIQGFPLDSLAIEKKTGKYYYDMNHSGETSDQQVATGFKNFFGRVLEL